MTSEVIKIKYYYNIRFLMQIKQRKLNVFVLIA